MRSSIPFVTFSRFTQHLYIKKNPRDLGICLLPLVPWIHTFSRRGFLRRWLILKAWILRSPPALLSAESAPPEDSSVRPQSAPALQRWNPDWIPQTIRHLRSVQSKAKTNNLTIVLDKFTNGPYRRRGEEADAVNECLLETMGFNNEVRETKHSGAL